MSVRVAHFADVHLGMTLFGRLDTVSGLNTRILEYLETLECLVEAVRSVGPDIILFAGDAYKTREPNVTLVTHFSRIMVEMAEIAPVIAVLGNHDRQSKGSGKRHSTEVWGDLESKHPIVVADDVRGICIGDAYVITLPWFYGMDLDRIFDDLDAALADQPDNTSTILLGHVGIDGAKLSSGAIYVYDPSGGKDFHLPLEIFESDIWDYVALGHIHKHQCLNDSPPVVYSGSLERTDWGERNDLGKGFVVADVDIGSATWKFVDLDVIPMVDIRLPLKSISKLSRANVDGAIIRVTVVVGAKERKYSVHQDVLDRLPKTYHWLDEILVETVETVVDRRTERSSGYTDSMDLMDALELYFQSKHPNNKEYVVSLLDCARDLIDGVDRDGI